MLKKIFSTFAALVFVFGATSQISNIFEACACVCYAHDGDIWDN